MRPFFDNGSYVVDHFDGKGAKVVSEFWEEHVLDEQVLQLIGQAGRYGKRPRRCIISPLRRARKRLTLCSCIAWEDSLELTSNITWSRSIPERFERLFGYEILDYLPLLSYGQINLGVQSIEQGTFRCLFDSPDGGESHVNNYRLALTRGYQEYLTTLRSWVHKTLAIEFSGQPAYGMPMDVQATVPFVDAPKCESLSFLDSIDSYRQFSGPAQLAGVNIISNEMGAVRGAGYTLHMADLLHSIHIAFSGGINRVVIHGQAYSGSYFETTWPGHTPFRYLFADPWGPRMPSWNTTARSLFDYVGRLQYVLQQGTPKIDVAVYNKEAASTMRTVLRAPDIEENGNIPP